MQFGINITTLERGKCNFRKGRGDIFRPKYKPPLKGIVQRDLTGVETRLKQSVLLSYSVCEF
jgi:hypothetical protein